MKEEKKKQEFVTVPELAKIMGLSRSQTFRRVKGGDIPAQKAGRIFLVPKTYADKFTGKLTPEDEKIIDYGVKRALKEYGDVIKKLGNA